MKKLFLATAAATALTAAALPASAATIDVNLSGVGATQAQNGAVTQVAISAAAAVGETGEYVDISSTGVNAAQLADVSQNVTQTATYNVNATVAGTRQRIDGAVTQAGVSIAGSGDLGAHSAIASTMANLGQSTAVSVNVKQ